MNNIVIRNIEPQEIKINGGGEILGITKVYVNGEDVTIGSSAYVIVPTKTSELINDSGFINHESDPTVPSYVKAISLSDITKWNNKQDELVSGVNIKTVNSNSLLGSGNIDIESVYTAGEGIAISEENVISNTITSYDDLTDLPTIPSKTSDLLNDSDYVTSSELAEVAFNGSYNALSDTPEIPASTSELVNDGEDGINPFITNETDGLINYYDKDFLYNLLPKVSDTDTSISLSPSYASKLEMELNPTELSQDGTPTPSTPEDIHVITGENSINVIGKNLIKNDDFMQGTFSPSTGGNNNVSSETTTKVSTKLIDISSCSNLIYSGSYFELISFYTKDLTYISYTSNNPSTVPATAYYCRIRFNNGGNDILVSTIQAQNNQLENGNTATTYTPYVSQEATIDLGDIEYCKIVTYEDKFIRSNDGTWQLEKNIGKVVLDGSNDEGWGVLSETTDYGLYFCAVNEKAYGITNLICSNFIIENSNAKNCMSGRSNNHAIVITLDKLICDYNISSFKTWLGSNNSIVYYVLDTPTYTPITGTLAEQLENVYKNMLSYSGTTNIIQVPHDLPFTIKATTLKDISNL